MTSSDFDWDMRLFFPSAAFDDCHIEYPRTIKIANRLGIPVGEFNLGGKGNTSYYANYQLIEPWTCIQCNNPRAKINKNKVIRVFLQGGYFKNMPSQTLPPIHVTYLLRDYTEFMDCFDLYELFESLSNIRNSMAKPKCTPEELYRTVYFLTALRNEILLRACSNLKIHWDPSVSFFTQLFYYESYEKEQQWEQDNNILVAEILEFLGDIKVLLASTYYRKQYNETALLNKNEVSPFSLLSMSDSDILKLPGISCLYESSVSDMEKRMNGNNCAENIALDILGVLCTCVLGTYRRIFRKDFSIIPANTVVAKTRWILDLLMRIDAYIMA